MGTTNRTHLYDYERAITENTGAVLKCKTSNYKVIGFSKEVSLAELVTLKRKWPDLLVLDDLGSGALYDLAELGLPREQTVRESVKQGADLVFFSGDKLISGPQAGIIVGKAELIKKIRKHPFARMLRICKLTDIALEHTLRLFLEPEKLKERLPTLKMLATKKEELKEKAEALRKRLREVTRDHDFMVEESSSELGGGSLPGTPIPTYVVSIRPGKTQPEKLSRALRMNEPPIITRVTKEAVHIDMRTLLPGDEEHIVSAFESLEKYL